MGISAQLPAKEGPGNLTPNQSVTVLLECKEYFLEREAIWPKLGVSFSSQKASQL